MIEADFQRDFDEYEFITKPVDDGVKKDVRSFLDASNEWNS